MKFHLPQKFFRGYVVLEKADSEINGLIEVREDLFGRRSVLVGGLGQSGHWIEKTWRKPINHLSLTIDHCLILGLGAGSVAKVIHNFFPKAKITGVEIDPMMIKMSKKYFGLSTVKNLKTEIKDAMKHIRVLKHQNKKFDLILVDIYLGDKVPEKAKTDEFIRNVKNLLSPSGIAIFNRLYYGEKKKEANQFETQLKKIFSQVESVHVSANVFFLCQ